MGTVLGVWEQSTQPTEVMGQGAELQALKDLVLLVCKNNLYFGLFWKNLKLFNRSIEISNAAFKNMMKLAAKMFHVGLGKLNTAVNF